MQPSMDPFTSIFGFVNDLLVYGNLAVAITVAAAVGSVVGGIWYATAALLKKQPAAQKTTEAGFQPARSRTPGQFAAELVGRFLAAFSANLIVAFVLAIVLAAARFVYFRGFDGGAGGITIGLLVWGASLGMTASFASFSRRLNPDIVYSLVYSFFTYLVMGAIIGAQIPYLPRF